MEPIDKLRRTAINALRDYHRSSGEERTQYLRLLAGALVDSRQIFTTESGDPDWRGRGKDYRQFVRGVFASASVTEDERKDIMSSVRYHAGNILREKLPPEELEDLGLLTAPPKQRAESYRRRTAQERELLLGDSPLTRADDLVSAAKVIETAVRRVSIPALAQLDADEQRSVRAAWTAVEDQVLRVSRGTQTVWIGIVDE